jgi:NTE family protein
MTRRNAVTKRRLNVALQGGGSHGAYTWGVLDRLLEEEDIELHGVSGTSAGAMNAVVLAHGYRLGQRAGARMALRQFWQEISALGCLFNPFKSNPIDEWRQNWNLDNTLSYQMLELMVRIFSPYQLNPFNLNPLRQLLSRFIDWNVLKAGGDIPVFITATSVRTGGPRVFRCQEVSVDAVLASACIPFYFQTVEIDGEPYWDGGYMGNPSIWPLIYYTPLKDILLVQINPLTRAEIPRQANEIINRLNEISFNSSLIAEMRAIDFVRRLLDENRLDGRKYKRVNMHMIPAPALEYRLNASSKLNTDMDFLEFLCEKGRAAADAWLAQNKSHIGVKASIDIRDTFLGPYASTKQPAEKPYGQDASGSARHDDSPAHLSVTDARS